MPAYPNPAITLTTIYTQTKIIVFKNVCSFSWHGGSVKILKQIDSKHIMRRNF